MKIDRSVAETLGEKLAGLELTDEEAVLLTTMLGEDDDVSGFGNVSLNFEEIKVTFMPQVAGPVHSKWGGGPGGANRLGYTEVEWTY